MYTYTHIHVRIYTCTCTYIHIHIYIHTHIRVCVCVYVFTYMHAYTYIDTCIRTYIHTCMHAYIHACIHTYIHTHINTHRTHSSALTPSYAGALASLQTTPECPVLLVVVYYCRTYVKLCAGGGVKKGRVLWDATSRGLCGRVGHHTTIRGSGSQWASICLAS